MNFALSDEQEFLKEAARGALSRVSTVEAAREALDGGALPDLWPTAVEAGWPGLLVSDAHGGGERGGLEAMVVLEDVGGGRSTATTASPRSPRATPAPRSCPPSRRPISTRPGRRSRRSA